MLSETRKITTIPERARLESECREAEPGSDALGRLEEARAGLWEALRIPGVEGQAGIFARLEDMQEALAVLSRDRALSGKQGTAGVERRASMEAVIQNCQETLRRMDRVFAFVGGLLEDRAGEADGGSYSFAKRGGGRWPPAVREGTGNWEG